MIVLKYKSNTKRYIIDSIGEPFRKVINDILVSENYAINKKSSNESIVYGDYWLTIEVEVNNTPEIQSRYLEIFQLVHEIDRCWIYAGGSLFNDYDIDFIGPDVIFPDGNIKGWSGNYKEAEDKLNIGKVHASFGDVVRITELRLPYLPLQNALAVRDAYLTAQEHIVALIDFHFGAYRTGNSHSSLIFLAKSIEIVQSILPGKTNKDKEDRLPEDLKAEFRTSLHDLFRLANMRYEIRHIIRDKQTFSLHERMNRDEIKAYKYDEDMLIRYVVCQEFNMPFFLIDRE